MKNGKTLLLVGGLALATQAMAGEPTPQQQGASDASMKVAIDPTTRKLRTVTAAESAALDAMQAASAKRSTGAARSSARAKEFVFPETDAEMQATIRVVNGITVMKPPASSLSAITVIRNADGTLQFLENGEPMTGHAKEAASE